MPFLDASTAWPRGLRVRHWLTYPHLVDAVELWDSAITGWKLPDGFKSAAMQPSQDFDFALSNRQTDEEIAADTPSRTVARDALRDGGTVLDIGCGTGVASLSLARKSPTPDRVNAAGRIIGIDAQKNMLAAFAARAERLGVPHAEIHGDWPAVSRSAPLADVVVCHHVLYYVTSLAPFVQALCAHARRRVVIEIPAKHPMVRLRALWQHFHGLDRPTGPTVDDATRALRQLGLTVSVQRWTSVAPVHEDDEAFVAHICSRLCLPACRHAEVRQMLLDHDVTAGALPMATLWWSSPHPSAA